MNPYATDPDYQRFKLSLPSFDERFSVAPVTRSIRREEVSEFPAPPPPAAKRPHSLAVDLIPGHARMKQSNRGRGRKFTPICPKTNQEHGFRRYGRANNIFKVQCRDCGVTYQVDQSFYDAVVNKKGPIVPKPRVPKGPK